MTCNNRRALSEHKASVNHNSSLPIPTGTTHSALVSLQLNARTLSQVARHVCKRLGSAVVVVTVMSSERADQLLGGPLAML